MFTRLPCNIENRLNLTAEQSYETEIITTNNMWTLYHIKHNINENKFLTEEKLKYITYTAA